MTNIKENTIWHRLSLNTIYNMDCIEGMKLIPDGSIDLIVTDPPYLTTSRWCAGNSWWMLQKEINKNWKVFQHNDIKIEDYAYDSYRILKEWSHCYIMTNHKNLIDMLNIFTNQWFHFIKSLIWNKWNKIMWQYYMSQFEYILFFRKWFWKKISNCWTADILEVPNKKQKQEDWKNMHDTEKPVELMKILIENSSHEWDIVFDPFMWIWTTAIACMNTNRNFIWFELDEQYRTIANNRIAEHTKQSENSLFW
jgi:site-specific DNA-methyltransferase (adenine-specific)